MTDENQTLTSWDENLFSWAAALLQRIKINSITSYIKVRKGTGCRIFSHEILTSLKFLVLSD